MLTVEKLASGYGESQILRDVNLKVEPGKVTCLMGRNGVGKSTLIKTIMGILKAKEGRIRYMDRDLTRSAPGVRARAGIGYVPQGREIFPQLTVFENLLLGLEASSGKVRRIRQEVLDRFPILKTMARRKGGDLSGGQQQQLAFARALVSDPSLLLLDEPTEGIQPSIVDDIQEVIHELKQSGKMAILLVEQSVEFVRAVADSFYIMEKGTIVASGNVEELDEHAVRTHLSV